MTPNAEIRAEYSLHDSGFSPPGFRRVSLICKLRHRGVHRSVDGQLQRAKKQISIHGLNRNHNHDLKNLFKGAAIVASSKPGPFQEFYTALLAKGIKPEMARLTLARKIATIVLIVWKRGACFDAQHFLGGQFKSGQLGSVQNRPTEVARNG